MKQPNIAVDFCGIKFKNPLVIPSGIIQELEGLKRAIKSGVGGVVSKSLTVNPREGNPLPRVMKYKNIGILNSVGLRNPGIDMGIKPLKKFIKEVKVPVIASISTAQVADYLILIREIIKTKADLIELNLSCPNTTKELGDPLGMKVETAYAAVSVARKAAGKSVKLMAKLSPNVRNIGDIAKAVQAAGADAISAINTVGPGMVIDIKTKKPILGNKMGGVSGEVIKPVAIRCIFEIYKAVTIPILGMGGVTTWEDAVEMMMAGATLIGVGSAFYFNQNVYKQINEGLQKYMKENKLKSLKEIVGLAHKN